MSDRESNPSHTVVCVNITRMPHGSEVFYLPLPPPASPYLPLLLPTPPASPYLSLHPLTSPCLLSLPSPLGPRNKAK